VHAAGRIPVRSITIVPNDVALAVGLIALDGRVAGDLPCPGCGYNLRTLATAGVCPECAYAVADAVAVFMRRLRFADPGWLRGLVGGLVWLLSALGATVVLMLVMMIVQVAFVAEAGATGVNPQVMMAKHMRTMMIAQSLISTVVLALVIIGVTQLTRREPGAGPETSRWTARRLTRVLAWVLLATFALSLGYGAWTSFYSPSWPMNAADIANYWSTPRFVFGAIFGVLSAFVYAGLPLALLRHLTNLLRRVPRSALVRFAQIEFWGLLVCGAVLLVGQAVSLLYLRPLLTAAASMAASAPTSGPVVFPTRSGVQTFGFPAQTYTYTSTSYVIASSAPVSQPASAAATGPAAPPFAPPPFPPGAMRSLMLAGVAGGTFACLALLLGAGVIVLLILACTTLHGCVRAAEQTRHAMIAWAAAGQLARDPPLPDTTPTSGTGDQPV
jgi:hypothetical protein